MICTNLNLISIRSMFTSRVFCTTHGDNTSGYELTYKTNCKRWHQLLNSRPFFQKSTVIKLKAPFWEINLKMSGNHNIKWHFKLYFTCSFNLNIGKRNNAYHYKKMLTSAGLDYVSVVILAFAIQHLPLIVANSLFNQRILLCSERLIFS